MTDLECRKCGDTATYAGASIMDAITGEPRDGGTCPEDPHGTHDWTEVE